MCSGCRRRLQCRAICPQLDELLPSPEEGRVDREDLPRIAQGRLVTSLILDHEDDLTPRQREVVRLYYRESLLQKDIASLLAITQQAVTDCLTRLRQQLFSRIKRNWVSMYRSRMASDRD
jgi:DNA-directed RNA polymerase specialized sigma24 family protein